MLCISDDLPTGAAGVLRMGALGGSAETPTAETPKALSAAEVWAAKKQGQMAKAAALRAQRELTSFGDFSRAKPLDFLDKLSLAEKRDNEKGQLIRKTPVPNQPDAPVAPPVPPRVPAPAPKATPKRLSRSASPASECRRKPGIASSTLAKTITTVEAKQKMQAHFRARAAAQRGGKSSTAAADPSRSLPSLGYTVLGPIAAGAFSTILRCRTNGTGDLVAVKSFDNLRCARDKDVGDARDRELQVLRSLSQDGSTSPAGQSAETSSSCHPHIANLIREIGDMQTDPHVHAVLQFAQGGSLKRYLQAPPVKGARDDAAREGMPAAMVKVGSRQLASALVHLHGLGICHRDVKPANILLSGEAGWDAETNATPNALHLKLCDFGFACICNDRRLDTEFNTPQYAAPEIAAPADAHRGYLGRPVDIWALGCVIYEMLHRHPAFKAEERFELEGLIRKCNFRPFTKHIKVPADAKALIRALLTPVESRPTAKQILAEDPWLSPAAHAARTAERERAKEEAAAAEEAKRRRPAAFGL